MFQLIDPVLGSPVQTPCGNDRVYQQRPECRIGRFPLIHRRQGRVDTEFVGIPHRLFGRQRGVTTHAGDPPYRVRWPVVVVVSVVVGNIDGINGASGSTIIITSTSTSTTGTVCVTVTTITTTTTIVRNTGTNIISAGSRVATGSNVIKSVTSTVGTTGSNTAIIGSWGRSSRSHCRVAVLVEVGGVVIFVICCHFRRIFPHGSFILITTAVAHCGADASVGTKSK